MTPGLKTQGECMKDICKSCFKNKMGVGVATGIAIGAGFGSASGNMAESVAIGVALGAALGAVWTKREKANRPNR
jgi:F0F1-type ATP synthase membrane subunit c/vacuolar-type H+-ATPase subunit K